MHYPNPVAERGEPAIPTRARRRDLIVHAVAPPADTPAGRQHRFGGAPSQLIQILLPSEESLQFLLALAFIPARYSGAAQELPGGYLTAVTSFVTYMLCIPAGCIFSLICCGWRRSEPCRQASRRLAVYVVLGAMRHCRGVHPPCLSFRRDDPGARGFGRHLGANGGGVTVRLFRAEAGEPDLAQVPLESLSKTLTDRRILTVLGFWVVLNIVFGLAPSRSLVPRGISPGRPILAAFCLGSFALAFSTPAASCRFPSARPDLKFWNFFSRASLARDTVKDRMSQATGTEVLGAWRKRA